MTTIKEPSAVSKFDLYSRGMHALHNVLGTVDAERLKRLGKFFQQLISYKTLSTRIRVP